MIVHIGVTMFTVIQLYTHTKVPSSSGICDGMNFQILQASDGWYLQMFGCLSVHYRSCGCDLGHMILIMVT